MKKLNKFIFGALLAVISCSVLAESTDSTNSADVTNSGSGSITYTIKPGYKYFRLDCERHSYVYTNEFTLSLDKKEITLVDDDGDWVKLINNECLIKMVKP